MPDEDLKRYLQRKTEVILKDLDTAYSMNIRLEDHINALRGWTVALLAGYVGILAVSDKFGIDAATSLVVLLPPFLIVLFSFLIEAFARMQLKFLSREKKTILEMFMIEDDEEFARKALRYEFRDVRLHQPRRRARLWIKDLFLGLASFGTLTWYPFLILVLISTYLAFQALR